MKFSIKEIMERDLKIDWATYEAAKYACENWHYSKCLPIGKLVKVGVWEKGRFIGVVLFARGASPFLGKKFNLRQDEICELVRVALRKHENPVSKIIAISLNFLKRLNKGLKLTVSFADSNQGHHGGIYQAGNWIYSGKSNKTTEVFMNGKWTHMRNAYHKKNAKSKTRITEGKHRYLMPLDKKIRQTIIKLSKPYPKRAQNIDSDVSSYQDEKGSANLTCALQLS